MKLNNLDIKTAINKILIIGNLGYVGPVLVRHIRQRDQKAEIAGFDTGFFANCCLDPYELSDQFLDLQIYGDVRNITLDQLQGYELVVYLAAISNDPMGNAFEKATLEINKDSALQAAKMAKEGGARAFVFASSCSVYGAGGNEAKSERSPLNPLTAYARSKIACEEALRALASTEFQVSCLRFATACGASPRLRLDLVLNDFVASAMLKGEIEILSDGSPWRPLIDVEEMCEAIYWAMNRDLSQSDPFLSLNVGFNDWNFTIKDLACEVKKEFPTAQVRINSNAASDKRSYRVDFSLYRSLSGRGTSCKPIGTSIKQIADAIERSGFRNTDFRESFLIRLNTVKQLQQRDHLSQSLWLNH